MDKRKGFIDGIFNSAKDALSWSNLFRRILFFLFFGFILSIRTFISNIDKVGKEGGGLIQYFFAFGASMWHGIGIALASVWVLITNFSTYLANNSWGSLTIGILMFIGVFGFFFQPVSLIINLLDGKGKQETGDSSGQAVGSVVRGFVTLVVVIILSVTTFYSGISDNVLTNPNDDVGVDNDIPVNSTVDDSGSVSNSINLLSGGDSYV